MNCETNLEEPQFSIFFMYFFQQLWSIAVFGKPFIEILYLL